MIGTAPALVCGLDEAGRGPAIGPMAIAAVWIDPGTLRALRRAGVRDSKAFGAGGEARARRAALAARVRGAAARVDVRLVPAAEIDRHVREGGLNRLECRVAHELLAAGPAVRRAWADGRRLFAPLRALHPALRALDRADARLTAVAAASIVAKDERDRAFLAWAATMGELAPLAERGMGYVNGATRAFLAAYAERYRRLPPETRRSWRWSALRDLAPDLSGPPAQLALW